MTPEQEQARVLREELIRATFPPLHALVDEPGDLHCPRCGAEHVWHGRSEAQRVCPSCQADAADSRADWLADA